MSADDNNVLRGRLLARVRRYVDHADTAAVHSDEAWDETARLGRLLLTQVGEEDFAPGLQLVGWLLACRTGVLEPGRSLPDMATTARLLAPVHRSEPMRLTWWGRSLVESFGMGAPDRVAEELFAEANRLMGLAGGAGGDESLERAVAVFRECARAAAPDHPDYASIVHNLGCALRVLFECRGRAADLDAAVRAGAEAVALGPREVSERPMFLYNLALAQALRYDASRLPGDRQAVLGTLREVEATSVAVAPGDEGARQSVRALRDWVGARPPRAEAAPRQPAADAGPGYGPGDLEAGRRGTGGALRQPGHEAARGRDGEGASEREGERGARWWRRRNSPAASDPESAGAAGNGPDSFRDAAQTATERMSAVLGGDASALDEAIEHYRRAIGIAAATGRDHATHAMNLGAALAMRFQQRGDPADLDAAVDATRRAVELAPGHSGSHANLLNCLLERHSVAGDPADLDTAVTAGRRALELLPPDNSDRAECGWLLATALTHRVERTGDSNDAVEAAQLLALLPSAGPDGAPAHDYAGQVRSLAEALSGHFLKTGDRRRLDTAVNILRLGPPRASDVARRAMMKGQLAQILKLRHGATNNDGDLHDAVLAAREGAAEDTAHTDMYGARLGILADVLVTRHQWTGDPADIDEAVTVARRAVDAEDDDGPNRAAVLEKLATALRHRFDQHGDRADLDAAVTAIRRSIAALPAEAPAGARAGALQVYGHILRTRFGASGDPADLDEAVAAARRSVQESSDHDGRFNGERLMNLALSLDRRHELTGGEQDLREAVTAARAAATSRACPPRMRLLAAQQWAQLLARTGDWNGALHAQRLAVELLTVIPSPGIERAAQEHVLSGCYGTAADAAACAIAAGRPEEALELLEQGRSVLWSQASAFRTDLAALRRAHPDIAARLEQLQDEFGRPHPTTGRPVTTEPEHGRLSLGLAWAAEEWERTVAHVRSLDGFAGFLRPARFAELSRAAGRGPVAVVNFSRYRCDALLVRPGAVRVVALPGLTVEHTLARNHAYLEAVLALAGDDQAGNPDRGMARQTILSTLEWLWDTVAEPVLDALGRTEPLSGPPADRPRLWWCPTSAMVTLPLHAAGYHDPDDAEPGRAPATVMDRVVSSYTTTLGALRRALDRPPAPAGGGRLLVVAQPGPLPYARGKPLLPGAVREMELLRHRFPTGLTGLCGAEATRAAVLDALPGHPCAHFACHGVNAPDNPGNSSLFLHDRNLTVTDIARLELRDAELAYLSACESAHGGFTLADEGVHLAAGFQFAGYRHVVASTWSVHDARAGEIADQVYGALAEDTALPDPSRVAVALHRTVRAERDAAPYDPARWAFITHTGP
ncbi:CHAT domain-containing protein [Streptomyces sp. NPDC091212]|uniref:CHAT domain-containing protein n=1 Tax=Streptomyces sp. NPDC091212 TaxID=3155191 RepID=UPI0034230928